MTALDYVVIGVVAVSVLLGWWRGLVYEVLSLLGWVAAYMVAWLFSVDVARYLPQGMGPETIRMVASFALLFVVTLIVSGILAWLLSKLVKIAGMGWLDGFLGALFGVLRGGFLVLVMVMLAGMTSVPKTKFWREAQLSAPLERAAIKAKAWLPASMAQKVHFETRH